MQLDINKRKAEKSTNVWKLNDTLLNNQGIKEETKMAIKNTSKQIKMKTQEYTKTLELLTKQF